jgi:hypothetical protein
MRWINQLGMRVRMLLFRRTAVAQLDDELRFHIEQLMTENRAAGMSAEEARHAALRTFGNPESMRENTGSHMELERTRAVCSRCSHQRSHT